MADDVEAFAVTSLCQFMSNPSITHWQAAKPVFALPTRNSPPRADVRQCWRRPTITVVQAADSGTVVRGGRVHGSHSGRS